MDLFITLIVLEIVIFGIFGVVFRLNPLQYVYGLSTVALVAAVMVAGWWLNATFLVPPNGDQMAFVILSAINGLLAWFAWLLHAGQYAATLRRK